MKVLIADDDSITRMALRRHLGKWGYEVVQAADGLEAWEIIEGECPPKIAILDWMMPEIEGVGICERIQQSGKLPFIYTILLTIRRDKEDIVKALDSGAHDFLSKPVHTDELRARIDVGARLVKAEDKLREYTSEMERLAVTDYLTGVYNRRFFFERATNELERFKRYHRRFSVLLVDIDHFKNINDTYGHLAGDAALQALTRKMKGILRGNDLLARFGGEEFSVLLPETETDGAVNFAERIRQTIEKASFYFDAHEFGFTVSIGVTEVNEDDSAVEQILARTDDALYRAKQNGRNRTEKAENDK